MFRLAGGRWAFHWTSLVYLVPPSMLAVAALEAPTGFTLIHALLTGVIAVSAALLSGLFYVRFFMSGRHRKAVHPVVLIGYWAAGGVGLGAGRILCVELWTDAPLDIGLRMFGSVVGSITWVSVISVAQAMLGIRRERLDELELGAARIERIRATADSNLQEQHAALAVAVRKAVEPHITSLLERFQAIGAGRTRNNLRALADEVQRVSGDVVRAASHRVAEPGYLPATASTRPRILTSIALDVVKRPITWPWMGALMLAAGTGPEIYRTSGVSTVVLGALGMSIAVLALLIVEIVTSRMPDRAATWTQWIALLALTVAVGLAPILVQDGTGVAVSSRVVPILLFVPLVMGGTLMTSVAVAARRHNLALLRALREQSDELEILAHGVQLQADDVRRRVAALLHGPVQGRLSAAAMLLGLHLGGQSGRSTEQVIEETERILEDAARDLEELTRAAGEQRSVEDLLEQLGCDWDGLMEIDWSVAPGVVPLLAADSALAATVDEIVTDMITNAARHGRARRAEVRIEVVDPPEAAEPPPPGRSSSRAYLEVVCDNDGELADIAPSEGGLVAALLRSMGGTRTLEALPGGRAVRAIATIPLAGCAARRPVSASATALVRQEVAHPT